MAQIVRTEFQTEIKAQADKCYEIFRSKGYLMPKICPDKINNIQVLEGDWNTVGSIKLWTFVCVGNAETVKEKVEAIDEQKKSVTYQIIDGEIANYYKNFKSTVQITEKGKGSLVKWSLEYEKLNEDIPDPDQYLDFVASVTRDVDAYLSKA